MGDWRAELTTPSSFDTEAALEKATSDTVASSIFYETDRETEGGQAGTDQYYFKTYLFYSGSVIDKESYNLYGYQDKFAWDEHVYVYANVTTKYSTLEVYVKTGERNDFVVTASGTGVIGGESRRYDVYEWVTQEAEPESTVTSTQAEFFVQPSSVGIVSEADNYIHSSGDPVGDLDGFDSHTYEQTYGDVAEPTQTRTNVSEGSTTSYGLVTDYVYTTIDGAEREFIKSNLQQNVLSVYDFMNSTVDRLASQIYNSSLIAKNTFSINPRKQITQKSLREISSIESQFSASIDTNLSLPVSSEATPMEESPSSGPGMESGVFDGAEYL